MTSPPYGTSSFGDPGVNPYAGGGGNLSRTGTVDLTANTSAYQQQMTSAAQVTDQLANSVGNLFTKVDQVFKLGGRTLKIISAADVATLGAGVANAAALQAQMAPLKATAVITHTSYAAFGRTVDSVFGKFPQHRGDIVGLVNEITNLNVKSKDLTNVATTMEKLGAASGENIPQLTNDLLQLNRSMSGNAARNVGGYANAVLTVSRAAGTSVSSVLSFSQAIAPIGRLAGLSTSAVLGISAAFSKAGADGYYAANTFNSIVNDITVLTRTGSPELAKYANFVGMTVNQFRKLPAKAQITDIFDAIAKGGPKALNFMQALGLGTRGLTAVQAVAQQGGLGHFIRISEQNSHNTRNLDAGSSAALGGLDATLGRLKNQATRFMDIFGAPLLGAVTGVVHGLEMFLSIVNTVVSHLGPLPTLIAALAAPLSMLAGIALTHAGAVGTIGAARLLANSGVRRSYTEGRVTTGLVRSGMSAEEAMMATTTGAAMAGSGRVPWRTSGGFFLGRGRGYLGDPVTSTEAAAGSGGAGRTAGRVVGGIFRAPTWFVRQQARTLSDVPKSDYERSAYAGTAVGGAAAPKAATAASQSATATGAAVRGTWNLIRAFADLAVQTARAGVYLGGLAAGGAMKAGGAVLGRTGAASTGSTGAAAARSEASAVNASVAAQQAALGRLKAAEKEAAAVAQRSSAATAAAARMEAEAVATSSAAQGASLTRLGRMRAGMSGMFAGKLGPAMGMLFAGQIAGSLVAGNSAPGSARSTAGSTLTDIGMGAAIGSFIPGIGPIVGGVAGGIYGMFNAPKPPARRMPGVPNQAAFRRPASAGGGTTAEQSIIARYLTNAVGSDRLFGAESDKEQADQIAAIAHSIATGGHPQGGQLLVKTGPAPGDMRRVNLDKLIANATRGSATGRRALAAAQRQGPLAGAITGSPVFASVAYGKESQNLGTQQRAIELSAAAAMHLATNSSNATAQLQHLADATGGAAGALLDAAAKWQRMQQGFQLQYMSRGGQLATTSRNVTASRSIALAHPANQADQDIYQGDVQAFEQSKQAYNQYLIGVFQQVQSYHVSMNRAQADFQLQQRRAEHQFHIQMSQQEQDYLRSRSRNIEDFNTQMARSAQSAAESIYDPYRVVQVQQVVNGGMLVGNLEDQNRRIVQQQSQLRRLRGAGLSQGAIDTLKLSDPNNAQQVNSIAQSVLNDPATIARINKLIATRQKATTGLVQSTFNEDFRNTIYDFNKGLNRAATDYQTAQKRAHEAQRLSLDYQAKDFSTMTRRAAEDLTTQMTELYGNFAQNYTRTLASINKDIGKAVPKLAGKLISEITNAEGNIAAAAAGGGDNSGGAGGPAMGSTANPITRAGTLGINSAGTLGSYNAKGQFSAYAGHNESIIATASERHIASPKTGGKLNASQAQSYAQSVMRNYGWGSGQMNALIQLWNNESGWRWNAMNPGSGAYGIPQALPASKMSSAGGDWHDNARTQIQWGLGYIKGRYGSPSKALNFWENIAPTINGAHWYGRGATFTGPSIIGVGERGPEKVLPLDDRGAQYMVSFYDKITQELIRRMPTAGRGLGAGYGGGPMTVHEDYRTFYTGPLQVSANSAVEMEMKMAARQKLKRLAQPARARG